MIMGCMADSHNGVHKIMHVAPIPQLGPCAQGLGGRCFPLKLLQQQPLSGGRAAVSCVDDSKKFKFIEKC